MDMSNCEVFKGTLHSTALEMWVDYGIPQPVSTPVPVSELRLVSGLPFRAYIIGGKPGPQEGVAFAAIAGSQDDLTKDPAGPLVRMHSACIFSEIGEKDSSLLNNWSKLTAHEQSQALGIANGNISPDCDCQAQRQLAQKLIAFEGGVFIDLAEQEGRGWGLDIKREIYRLHREENLDTVEACQRLGIDSDIRRYGHCARFLLETLGLTKVRLMSNNPRKSAALQQAGIAVTSVSLVTGITDANAAYLRTKRDKLQHDLPADL